MACSAGTLPWLHPATVSASAKATRARRGGLSNLSHARPSRRGVTVREKGQHGAGPALLVAEVKMPGARIVEIHRALDEPEAKHVAIEGQVAGGVAGNGGDMVDAGHENAPEGADGAVRVTPNLGMAVPVEKAGKAWLAKQQGLDLMNLTLRQPCIVPSI